MKTNALTTETHNKNEANKATLVAYSNQVLEMFCDNKIFNAVCRADFEAYLSKNNVSNAKKIFVITKLEGMLTAYKLFYVGCSRARKNLLIAVEKSKVLTFKEDFVTKLSRIGFTVRDD